MKFLKKLTPQKGDILRVKRKAGYYHFGIAKSENEVIHFTGPVDDSIKSNKDVKIRLTSLDLFLRGDKLEILQPYSSQFSRDEVVKRALSHLDQHEIDGKKYDFITNNCEHFARKMYFDKKESKQVKKGEKVLLGVAIASGVIGVGLATGAVIGVNKKTKEVK